MKAMKRMAVRAQDTVVNVVTFLGLGQDKDEPCGSFSARLKGQAAICNFTVKCSLSSCQTETIYKEKMVAHQLVRGLEECTIQEQVLSHAASNPDLDLTAIQKFIEAKETGRRSGALIAGSGGLNTTRLTTELAKAEIGSDPALRHQALRNVSGVPNQDMGPEHPRKFVSVRTAPLWDTSRWPARRRRQPPTRPPCPVTMNRLLDHSAICPTP